MKKSDFHVHTEFSADSQLKLTELLPHAIRLGYAELAVTEHLDLLPQELSVYGLPSLIKYKTTIKQLRNKYPEIKLLCGIEVGDYQEVRDFADSLLKQMQFDLVLGAVHFIGGHINVAVPLKNKLSPSEVREYYEKNLFLVETCDIDVLAHLGVYKRYYEQTPDESHCLPVIRRIFETIIEKKIALELNLSSLRKTYKHLLPEQTYLELYKNLGGKLVTLGSDSHVLEHFDDNYAIAEQALIDYGFELLQVSYK